MEDIEDIIWKIENTKSIIRTARLDIILRDTASYYDPTFPDLEKYITELTSQLVKHSDYEKYLNNT